MWQKVKKKVQIFGVIRLLSYWKLWQINKTYFITNTLANNYCFYSARLAQIAQLRDSFAIATTTIAENFRNRVLSSHFYYLSYYYYARWCDSHCYKLLYTSLQNDDICTYEANVIGNNVSWHHKFLFVDVFTVMEHTYHYVTYFCHETARA